jgi:enoyl-CoA hydratase
MEDFHSAVMTIGQIRQPVVALVNGVTAAGGLELLLACDFAIAARSAQIGDAHLKYGQMGGGGILSLLPRLIGPARARELIFSARFLSADEAQEWRIVNRVVEDDALLEAGLEFSRAVAGHSFLAVANAKYVLNSNWADAVPLEAALRLERERTAFYTFTSGDSHEGLQAFVERREPRFNQTRRT